MLVCWCVGVCIDVRPSNATERALISTPCDVCGGPKLCPPSTFARVQNRFEFAGLGGDMCSNCARRHWDYSLVLVVPCTRYQAHIREHSSIYVREYRVYIGARASPVCYVLVSRVNIHIFILGTRCFCSCC